MIEWDEKNKQLLTSLCTRCPESYFAPYSSDLPHVGCCSYSPTFTLFEIYKIIKAGKRDFFLNQIYYNPHGTVEEDQVVVHAYVNERFYELSRETSSLNIEDLRLQFSVCQFFEKGKGCGLDPQFKNSTCRSFICSAVEEMLNPEQKAAFSTRVREIHQEVQLFNEKHWAILREKGWNLQQDITAIMDYLQRLDGDAS